MNRGEKGLARVGGLSPRSRTPTLLGTVPVKPQTRAPRGLGAPPTDTLQVPRIPPLSFWSI